MTDAGPASDLVLTIDIPQGALTTPGRTFAGWLGDVTKSVKTSLACPGGCFVLPPTAAISGTYTVLPSDWINVGSTIFPGATGGPAASLPSHVTYRPLWPPDAGALADDAVAQGLPMALAESTTRVPTPGPNATFVLNGVPAAPGGTSAVGFQTFVLSGAAYARIISPDAPFDREFPPDVHVLNEPFAPTEFAAFIGGVTGGSSKTSFSLSRAEGFDGGWTAYLRDAATKIVLSPVKPLSGNSTPDGGVLLVTNHVGVPDLPSQPLNPPEALTGTELVLAPPPTQPLPAEVFSYPAIALLQEAYAKLANPASITGQIGWGGSQPGAATLVFEAASIYAVQPSPSDVDAGGTPASLPTAFPPQPNFEYTTRVAATPDGSGASGYTIPSFPRGIYRVTVRPDGETTPAGQLGIVHASMTACFDTTDGTLEAPDAGTPGPAITLALAPTVAGTVKVADGRLLPRATVQAIPTACAPTAAACAGLADSANCMPRASQTVTDTDGHFSMPLDPGTYQVSVDPGVGSRLPIVSKSVTVPTVPLTFVVPAPTHFALQINDALGPPIANAVVRVFSLPAQGPAVEVGRTLTDSAGRFDMYLDPALQ